MQVTSELFSSIKQMVLKEVSHEQAVIWGLPASSHEGGCATTCASHRVVAHGQYEGLVAHLNL